MLYTYFIFYKHNMRKFFGLLWRGIILAFSIFSFTSAYTQEEINAYNWAYKNGLTTQPTIEAANLNWKLTRQELSKMLTNYIENVAWVKQTSNSSCYFTDEDKITPNLKPYTKKICSYKIMWSNWEDFRPTSKVTRAELGTTISRMLWGDRYNVNWKDFYIYHLNALKDNGIMNNLDNPTKSLARRWDTFIMFKRLADKFGSEIDLNGSSYISSDWSDSSDVSLFGENKKVVYTWQDGTKYYYDEDFLKMLKKLADKQRESDLSKYLEIELDYSKDADSLVGFMDDDEKLAELLWIDLDEFDTEDMSEKGQQKIISQLKKWFDKLNTQIEQTNTQYLKDLKNVVENIKNDKFWLKDKYEKTESYVEKSTEMSSTYFETISMILESQLNPDTADEEELMAAAFGLFWLSFILQWMEATYTNYQQEWWTNAINVFLWKSNSVQIDWWWESNMVNSEEREQSQKSSRDVARKNDLAQIQTAIITSQQDYWMWPWVNEYNLANWVATGATQWMRISEISNNLYKAWMSSIPWDPNGSSVVYWLWEKYNTKANAKKNWAEWDYLYVVSTRNGVKNAGFTLMAKTETEERSNRVVCKNGQWLDKWYIKNDTDLKEVKPCYTVTKWNTCSASACTYTDEEELRYILIY